MREIKFRAWHKELKILFYPPNKFDSMGYCRPHTTKMFFLPFIESSGVYHLSAHMDWLGNWFEHGELQDAIFMQYTGLKDKNGEEIYEGDIIELDDDFVILGNKIKYADFFDGSFIFCEGWDDFDRERLEPYSYNQAHSFCKIIGNIHENPSLLN